MKTTISNQERDMLAQMDAQEQHFTTPEKDQSIAEKALKSIILNHGELNHIRLADMIRNMGGNMPPSECKAFLESKGKVDI
jgi:hypothetical protein